MVEIRAHYYVRLWRWQIAAGTTLLLLLSGTCLGNEPSEPLLVDPTRPLGSYATKKQDDKPSWILQAVYSGDSRLAAVINGQLVHQGERVQGGVVQSITRNRVVLRVDGASVVLNLRTTVLQPTSARY